MNTTGAAAKQPNATIVRNAPTTPWVTNERKKATMSTAASAISTKIASLMGLCAAMIDVMIRRGRSRFSDEQIPRDNVRALVRSLRDGRVVAYMPDQTYVGRQSELLPFFGEPAMTNTATTKLAALVKARDA